MEDLTSEDYRSIGLRSGLEIHQQLDTKKKLFCRCPVKTYSQDYDAQILRHMRPTLSELGEYDGTALMEFKTRKEILYQINKATICTYEMDDTPPFELNQEALDIALEITMLLNCKLIGEVHIARKQYLDGSIPAGFQRTTILGVDGWIPYRDRRIGIIQLGLEEDSCREVSDEGHNRIYRTDRLGIPLVELVTSPEMHTPHEVADVAMILRWLTRSSGKVRRGIGAARQDVNVSVEGGCRVEIKGVSRIPLIPLLVHNEAFRQISLLDIRTELARRGITLSSFESGSSDITDVLTGTVYPPAAAALGEGLRIGAVVLRGYRGILSTPTQPGKIFAGEVSDRVRVIACLDSLPNIAHTGMKGSSFSSGEWEKITEAVNAGGNDEIVIVWGDTKDLETAVKEIVIRAREALEGVCNETRQSLPDGTNGFERILPGPDRMYPDTDLPPLAINDERIDRIRSALPERPWDRAARYESMGVPREPAHQMSITTLGDLLERAITETSLSPVILAHFLQSTLNHMKRKRLVPHLHDNAVIDALKETGRMKLPIEAAAAILEKTCGPEMVSIAEAALGMKTVEETLLEAGVDKILAGLDAAALPADLLRRFAVGQVRMEFRDPVSGLELSRLVDKAIINGNSEVIDPVI